MSVPLDADHEESAIYVVDGEIEIGGDRHEAPQLLVFRPGDSITVRDTYDVLGGKAAPHLVAFRLLEQGAH